MKKLTANLSKIVVVVVVLAVVAGGLYYFLSGSDSKKVTARFTAAVGIYPGTPVRILGVNVGEVDSVTPKGSYVEVVMDYDAKYKLPSDGGAVEVANSLVSDRYIQLTPVYRTGEKAMASGATIPVKHTAAPAELDDIYAAVNKLSVALGPTGANKGGQNKGALSELVNVAAANLKGNGAALGNSITQVSRAAQTLVHSKEDLFGTVRNLRTLTSALKNSDSQVRRFNTLLASVASNLAAERGDLGAALHQLGIALDAVGNFVRKNAGKFNVDIKGLRSILGTVVKNKDSVNEALSIAPVALANLVHTYDPKGGFLGTRSNLASLTNVNLLATVGQVCSTLVGSVIGGLAGLAGLGGNVQQICTGVANLGKKSSGGTPTTPTTGSGTGGLPLGTLVGGTK